MSMMWRNNMDNFATKKRYDSLLDIEECIRFYPPDISELGINKIFYQKKRIALYIHIPFCKYPCGFCPFNQYKYSSKGLTRYFSALTKEITIIKKKIDFSNIHISSVWVGGGTPLDLSEEQLETFLKILNDNFNLSDVEEFTIEGKPVCGMITKAKLHLLTKYNVTRVSLGVQSTNDKYLKLLGRNYTFKQVKKTIKDIIKSGLDINLDMIYNIPGETIVEVEKDVQAIAELGVEHVSWFYYIAHAGTPLTKQFNNQQIDIKRDKIQFINMYNSVKKIMNKCGYKQYTPYYYTKNRQCQYHVDRWKMPQIDVLGLGAGAFSSYDGWIYTNAHNLDLYISELDNDVLPIKVGKKVTIVDELVRYIVLGCKFFDISISEYERLTGIDFMMYFKKSIETLSNLELIEIVDGVLHCTEKGQAFNNAVAVGFSDDQYYDIGQPQPLFIREEGF